MKINRNDIMIAVTLDGEMYIAQGGPACDDLRGRNDLSDCEGGLFYSQLAHRCAWFEVGSYCVGTPTEANGHEFARFGRVTLSVGVHYVGKVRKG